jgi:large repetitive protein
MHARVRARALVLTLAFALGLAGLLSLSGAAHAAGTPNLTGTIESPTVLHGDPVPVSMTVTNPAGQPYGYNLSYRVVLPPGVRYKQGAPSAPTTIAGPAAGETTLIFRNVSDISPASTAELRFEVVYDPLVYDVGDTFPIVAEAFANDDPRNVPRFTGAGVPDGPRADSFTGRTGTMTATTKINAIEVIKDEPSWEGEILRGVHDHQTVYTVTVRNNGIRPTTRTKLVDYLPAGLEFLGCGGAGADHTTNAPTNPGSAEEYPGKGPIVVAPLAGCVAPATVETVNVDPDGAGPLPRAVYTKVTWDVGTLAATSEQRFTYRAAIPIRENTMTWSGATPAITGAQATNLDNNSGRETRDEQELTNYATAAGDYNGTIPVSDDFHLTRTAEDWVVHKEGSSRELAQGALTEWTLTLETSEYRSVKDAVVTDTVPSGLCPIDAVTNHTTGNSGDDSECDPVAGRGPSAPYTSVTENPDGTFTVRWDKTTFPQLAQTNVSDRFTIRFTTRTRRSWQSAFVSTTPILTRDAIENTVTTTATAIVRCLPSGTPDCTTPGTEIDHDAGYGTGTIVPDASAAGQVAPSPSIEKLVAVSGTDCASVTWTRNVPVYHPGDRVCWKLRIDFPLNVDTRPQAIRDFVPAGAIFELPGREGVYGANDVAATLDAANAADGNVQWTVDGGFVPKGGRVFERTISTIVGLPNPSDPPEIPGNLMKFSSLNTAGTSVPLRDKRDITLEKPEVSLLKGVQEVRRAGTSVLGPFGANTDHRQVRALDVVTYRIDVRNNGGQDATDVVVWDNLPREYGCTLPGIGGISDLGTCAPSGLGGDRITWTIPTIAAGQTKTLTYQATVPADIGPARQLNNTAGVVRYDGVSNIGTRFNYKPANNIDGTVSGNASPASDPSDVYTADAAVTKSATTPIADAAQGNSSAQATIGERIDYTVRATIPAGTTLAGVARLTDALDSATRQPYVAGSARATLDGAALPAGFTLDDSGSAPFITFPSDFAVAPGGADAVIELRFSTIVADVTGNSRTDADVTNQATLTWTDTRESPSPRQRRSAVVRTQLVEPLISQTKTDDRNPSRVIPGEVVEYTLTTSNSSAGRVSTAHNVQISDVVPVGLSPIGVAPGNARLADGDPIPGGGGAIWNAGPRTITKTVATILPGASHTLRYRVSVDDPAIGGAELTNRVTARTQSLPDSDPGRRTTGTGYEARADDTVRIQGASVTKSVSPARLTVGEHATYDLVVTIPANVSLYDVTVTDLLPANLAFDRYVSETCVSGCPVVNTVQRYDAVLRGDGTTTIAWDFGDIAAPLSVPQVVRLTYTAHVRDSVSGTDVVAGDRGVNTVTVGSNRSDRVGPFDRTTIPTGHEEVSPQARATVTVIEPRLSIDKKVKVGTGSFVDGPATALSNDLLTYQVTVRNSGDAPAYDATVTDQPDVELTDVTMGTLPSGVTVTKAWSAGDRRIAWTIDGPIAPGDSVTLTYTARFVAASDLSDGQSVDNTAAVPLYRGVRSSERDDPSNISNTYRSYTDGGSDSTRVVLDFPTLELVKTTGLGAGPSYPETGNAEVGQAYPWRVVVRNTSATAAASDVVVRDTLPANWSYTAGSATLSPGGATEPTVTRNAAGDRLAWTIASLAPGASVTISYTAVPSAEAARTPGLGAAAHVNVAQVTSARDPAGNTGNRDGPYGTPSDDASATLQVPTLTIDKRPDNGTAVAGSTSSFTIAVRNTGAVLARNLTISDLLPSGLTYDATGAPATASPSTGFSERSVTPNAGTGETTIVWHLTQLAAGATVTITVPVRVAADVADDTTLTNTASVRSDEQPDPVRDDGGLRVEARADLSIVKDGPARYTAGQSYEWTLRVRNAGPSDAQNVAVSDPLPAGVRFVSATNGCTEAAGTVTCAIGTAAVGYDRTFTIRVDVDAATVGTLSNTATVTTDTDETNTSNNRDRHDADPDPIADITVEKTADPATISRGGQSVFTLVVSNAGPSVARDVELDDPLPAGLGFVAVDDNRCGESAGTVSCAFGDLAVGARVTVRITVTGNQEGAWRNEATVTTTTPQPPTGGLPDRDDATVTVGPVADLGIVKTGPATVAAGGQLTWQLEVTNHGDDPATGVTVTDTLPAGVRFVSAGNGCAEAAGTVTCAIGDLAVGERATVEITVTVPHALGSQTLVNTAVVRGDQIDENPSNDRDEATTEVGPSTDLAIVKTGPALVAAGGEAAWTLLVTNNGPSTATGVTVADALPAGVTFASATPSQGACAAEGQLVSCALGTLAPGASVQVQVTGRVAGEIEGQTLVNVAAVRGEQPDPNPDNDRSEVPTRVGPPDAGNFDLAIDKRLADGARPVLGGTFAYALTVTNSGPAKAEGVTVTDTVPTGLKVRGASTAGGTCTVRGQLVSCALGTLAAGESRTIALRVTALAAGTVTNTATVAARVADRDPANDRSSVPVKVTAPKATLKLVKRALGRQPVNRGKTVRFRIAVTNTSANAASNVVVCDRLPEGLSLRSTGGGRLRRGDLCWTVGLLPAQATRTFTLSARVLADARGPRIGNVAVATAGNAPRVSARAVVRVGGPLGGVLPTTGRGGGVTG